MVSFQTPLPPNTTTQYPQHQRKTILLLDQNFDKQLQYPSPSSSSASPSSSSSSSPKKRKWLEDHMTINKSLHHHQTQWISNKSVMMPSVDLDHLNKNPTTTTTNLQASDSCKGQLSCSSLDAIHQTSVGREVVHDFYVSSPAAARFLNHNHNNTCRQNQEISKATTTTTATTNHIISLDLALNLTSSSSSSSTSKSEHHLISQLKTTATPSYKKPISKPPPSPSRRSEQVVTTGDYKSSNTTAVRSTLALFSSSPAFDKRSDRDHDQKVVAGVDSQPQDEMVAAACMRCHMLVMMCKSSPSCPNCKFMHPPDHSLPTLMLNPTLSLSC